MNVLDVVVLLAYASLLVELTAFPIPSEASTWQLLASQPRMPVDDALARARSRSRVQKVLRFFLPTALGVALWLLPLGCVLVPGFAAAIGCHSLPWLQTTGIVLILIGRAITFASVLQLRAQRRRDTPPGFLFRRSRNPGLVGMFTCYLGLCCAFGSPLLWLGLPLYLGNMHVRVRIEEAHLAAQRGAAWTEYAARVPRYLGW